jgi:hypothetical protein
MKMACRLATQMSELVISEALGEQAHADEGSL